MKLFVDEAPKSENNECLFRTETDKQCMLARLPDGGCERCEKLLYAWGECPFLLALNAHELPVK